MDLNTLQKSLVTTPHKDEFCFVNDSLRFIFPTLDFYKDPGRSYLSWGMLGVFSLGKLPNWSAFTEHDDLFFAVIDFSHKDIKYRGRTTVLENINQMPALLDLVHLKFDIWAAILQIHPSATGAKQRMFGPGPRVDIVSLDLLHRMHAPSFDRLVLNTSGILIQNRFLDWINDFTFPRSGHKEPFFDISVKRTKIGPEALPTLLWVPVDLEAETFVAHEAS